MKIQLGDIFSCELSGTNPYTKVRGMTLWQAVWNIVDIC